MGWEPAPSWGSCHLGPVGPRRLGTWGARATPPRLQEGGSSWPADCPGLERWRGSHLPVAPRHKRSGAKREGPASSGQDTGVNRCAAVPRSGKLAPAPLLFIELSLGETQNAVSCCGPRHCTPHLRALTYAPLTCAPSPEAPRAALASMFPSWLSCVRLWGCMAPVGLPQGSPGAATVPATSSWLPHPDLSWDCLSSSPSHHRIVLTNQPLSPGGLQTLPSTPPHYSPSPGIFTPLHFVFV